MTEHVLSSFESLPLLPAKAVRFMGFLNFPRKKRRPNQPVVWLYTESAFYYHSRPPIPASFQPQGAQERGDDHDAVSAEFDTGHIIMPVEIFYLTCHALPLDSLAITVCP